MIEPKTVKLDHPVTVDGQEWSELTMRSPKARDSRDAQRGVGSSAADTEIRLFSNLCEAPPAVIEELEMADYLKLTEAYSGFLGR